MEQTTMASNDSNAATAKPSNGSSLTCPFLKSRTAELVQMMVYIIILILAVFGNSLVMLVTRKVNRRRNIVNLLIFNMAAADFVFTVCVVGRHLVVLTTASQEWYLGTGVLGNITCKLNFAIQDTCTNVTMFTLLAIAIERYYAVVHPMKCGLVSAKVHRAIFLMIWVCACALNAPYFYIWRLVRVQEKSYCVFDKSAAVDVRTYHLTLYSIAVMFPLVLLVIIYSKIIWTLYKKRIPGIDMNNCQIKAYRERRNRNVLKLAIAILLAFVICWLPLYVVMYFVYLKWDPASMTCAQYTLLNVTVFLAYTNAAINPAVYFFFSENIRTGALMILKCRRGKKSRYSASTQSTSDGTGTFIKARTLVMSMRLDKVRKETRELQGSSVELKKFGNGVELGTTSGYDAKDDETQCVVSKGDLQPAREEEEDHGVE